MAESDNLTEQEQSLLDAWKKSGARPDDPTEGRVFATLVERGLIDDTSPPKPAKTEKTTAATKAKTAPEKS